MLKIPEKFRKFIVPAIFVIIAIVSVLLTPLVKVNYNISDYLDDSSETKVSLNIMESEFGLNGSVQVMIRDIDVATANEVKETLEGMENVLIVNFDSQNENYYKNNIALFTVMTNGDEYSNTSRAVAAEIQETLNSRFGDKVEYDGSVVEKLLLQKAIKSEVVMILAISLCLVALLMLITAESWLEPFILLLSSGFAVLINMGSNVIFGEISYITNAVASILQLALSIDYSIVLLHKYRAIKAENSEISSENAMKSAVKGVLSPVSASALTTMAGLLALLFMSFRIGFDIGSVLMKSILISAITSLTLLPSLLLIFENLMQKTKKPALHVSGKIFTNFTFKFKHIIIRVAAVFILIGAVLQCFNSYSFTDGSNKNKNLQEAFGNNNSVVVLYPNRADSKDREKELKDILEAYKNGDGEGVIKGFTAYSNTIGVEYGTDEAEEMFGLSPEKAKLLFQMYHLYADSEQLKLNLEEVLEYASDLIKSGDPDIDGYVSDDMGDAIDFLLYVEGLMDTPMTADEFNDKIMNHPFVKENIGESPVAQLLIDQMYGIYFYRGTTPQPVKFGKALASFLSEINTNKALADKIGDSLTEETKDLMKPICRILEGDLLPHPGGMVTKERFKQILSIFGIEGANDATWLILFGNKTEVTTAQFLNVLQSRYMDMIVDENTPAGELMDYILYNSGTNAKPVFKNYEAFYKMINGTYEYHEAIDEVEDEFAIYYNILFGKNLHDEIMKNTGMPLGDMDFAIEQLYIFHYLKEGEKGNINGVPTGMMVSPRNLVNSVIDKLESDESFAKALPEKAVGMLYDLMSFTELMDDKTRYDYKTLSSKVIGLTSSLRSVDIGKNIDEGILMGVYVKYGAQNISTEDVEAIKLVRFIYEGLDNNAILSAAVTEDKRDQLTEAYNMLSSVENLLLGENYSRILITVDLPVEGKESIEFVKYLKDNTKSVFGNDAYIGGEIVSTMEQKEVFNTDNIMISIVTIVSIFLIILLIFKSLSLPVILVAAIQGAIWISMSMSLGSGPMFFMSYIMATCILMGATIDYGILMSSNYVQARKSMEKEDALAFAVDSAMPTIFTSGIILMICGLVVGLVASQMCISSVGFLLFRGTLVSVIMITVVLPSLLYVLDKFVIKYTRNKLSDFKDLFNKDMFKKQ